MNVNEIGEFFRTGHDISSVITWILLLMTIVQIAPIKINPWSWIAKHVGRAINGEVIEKVDALDKEFHVSQANAARIRILRFNDELLQPKDRVKRHSKEMFDDVLGDIDFYEKYCLSHPDYKNNKAVLAIKNIKRCYEKCEQDKDFL